MRVVSVTIHNFRSIVDAKFHIGNYSLLVGANNSGKSNVMDALRVFYENLKYEQSRDFPKLGTTDQESWIDIEYSLTEDEYENLKDEYRRENNKLKVRKYLKSTEKDKKGNLRKGIFGYSGDQIHDEHFYGEKNVQQGKLGHIIFIPAVSKVDEHMKMSGPSVLRDLLEDILKKLVKDSPAYEALNKAFNNFKEKFMDEKTADERSLRGLEKDINEEIIEWDTTFKLNINPVTETDIVKSLIDFDFADKNLDKEATLKAQQFGQGFQRHLIFTFIKTAAKYQAPPVEKKKKEFSPRMTLLLFEEPEAFLHPPHQMILSQSLQKIAQPEGNQVLLSTHSPHFVSQNMEDITSICRLCRVAGGTEMGQIDKENLDNIFTENQGMNALVIGTCYEANEDDLDADMEAVKYFLWLDPGRCELFFARQVLLVEGPTERVLLNYLLNTGKIRMPKGGVFILDCIGKFNIHRFMNLLEPFGIPHSVLFDEDSNCQPEIKREVHARVRGFINDQRNPLTHKIESFSEEIEDFLGIPKAVRPHRKPQHLMLKYKRGEVAQDKIDELIKLVESLLQY